LPFAFAFEFAFAFSFALLRLVVPTHALLLGVHDFLAVIKKSTIVAQRKFQGN